MYVISVIQTLFYKETSPFFNPELKTAHQEVS